MASPSELIWFFTPASTTEARDHQRCMRKPRSTAQLVQDGNHNAMHDTHTQVFKFLFYYANLEENVLGFLRKETPTATGSSELNLLMRLTDDYLLITTEKNNAMLFIEKLCMLS